MEPITGTANITLGPLETAYPVTWLVKPHIYTTALRAPQS
jgi:hypothetical protein